jgi:phosphoglycolate phosphatase-like HAD superfamily hydrolase
MSRLETVIFDVDGTLVDSERDGHRTAFNAAFEEAGPPDRWDVATYGRLLKITGGGRRLAFWFESTGRSAEEARELALRLHERKTRLMRELIEQGGVRALVVDLGRAVAGPDASMTLGDLGSLRHRNAKTNSLTTVRTPI